MKRKRRLSVQKAHWRQYNSKAGKQMSTSALADAMAAAIAMAKDRAPVVKEEPAPTPYVPPVQAKVGHSFRLRNGAKAIITNMHGMFFRGTTEGFGQRYWPPSGRHPKDEALDLVEDLGPTEPVAQQESGFKPGDHVRVMGGNRCLGALWRIDQVHGDTATIKLKAVNGSVRRAVKPLASLIKSAPFVWSTEIAKIPAVNGERLIDVYVANRGWTIAGLSITDGKLPSSFQESLIVSIREHARNGDVATTDFTVEVAAGRSYRAADRSRIDIVAVVGTIAVGSADGQTMTWSTVDGSCRDGKGRLVSKFAIVDEWRELLSGTVWLAVHRHSHQGTSTIMTSTFKSKEDAYSTTDSLSEGDLLKGVSIELLALFEVPWTEGQGV